MGRRGALGEEQQRKNGTQRADEAVAAGEFAAAVLPPADAAAAAASADAAAAAAQISLSPTAVSCPS